MNLVWCISITNFPFSFSYRVVHICRSLGLFFIWLLWFAHQHCKLACLKSGIRTIWRIGPEPHQFSGAVSCQTSSRTDGSDSHWFWSKRRSTEKNSLSEPAALPENNLFGPSFQSWKILDPKKCVPAQRFRRQIYWPAKTLELKPNWNTFFCRVDEISWADISAKIAWWKRLAHAFQKVYCYFSDPDIIYACSSVICRDKSVLPDKCVLSG